MVVARQGIGTSTPQLKVGEQVYNGKAEPIIGTTMAFATPKAGSAGMYSGGLSFFAGMIPCSLCVCVCLCVVSIFLFHRVRECDRAR